jgi:lysozyme
MGPSRFRGFIKTNAALLAGDYSRAADEMVDSKWFRQTGRRAKKLVEAMRTGEWKEG